MIFVNEPPSPLANSPAAGASIAEGRKVVTSTAEPAASVSPPEPRSDPASRAAPPNQWEHLDALIEQAASRHDIDPDLIRAIVKVESDFNPYAVSRAGARGLMQLVPATARRFGVSNPFDPWANLDGGIRYLKHLLGMYNGDLHLTLAAYNAGENSVARFGGVPRFRETQNYLRKIAELYPLHNQPAGFRSAPRILSYRDASGVIHFSNTDFP
ncbi:MAG TPA: lytic transglycosylase domain-containing protein [Terriglobia bacterium]|nr:lytic transglycosylase domain-containing protein [Terriglobia bacterium]